MPATIRPAYLSDKGFGPTSGREKHAEPSDTVRDVTARTTQRQAKRLRAETEATDYSTIAPGFWEQGRISARIGLTFVSGKPAWKRPFLFGRRVPPLPAADEGGLSAPQPRLWRAVAKQDRKRHLRQGGRTVSLFGQVPKREMGLESRSSCLAYTTRKTLYRDTGGFLRNAPPIFFSSCRKEDGPRPGQKKRAPKCGQRCDRR